MSLPKVDDKVKVKSDVGMGKDLYDKVTSAITRHDLAGSILMTKEDAIGAIVLLVELRDKAKLGCEVELSIQ